MFSRWSSSMQCQPINSSWTSSGMGMSAASTHGWSVWLSPCSELVIPGCGSLLGSPSDGVWEGWSCWPSLGFTVPAVGMVSTFWLGTVGGGGVSDLRPSIGGSGWKTSFSGMCLPSIALTGLICSGACRYNFPFCVTQTVWAFSCTTTFIGPLQPSFNPDFQIMTHSPDWYTCLAGLVLLSKALRKTASLSAMWYARRAASLLAKCCLNKRPWQCSASARACAGSWLSLHTDPGNRVCLPNTSTSGAKPFLMLNAFFACVQCASAVCISWESLMGCSRSYLLSISASICPCRSAFPFCQCASVLIVVHFTLHCCMNWANSSAFSSVAASTSNSFGLPAHENQLWTIMSMACSTERFGAYLATWKLVLWSTMW